MTWYYAQLIWNKAYFSTQEVPFIMPTWMTLAKGPVFLFVMTVLVLGLLRLFLLKLGE